MRRLLTFSIFSTLILSTLIFSTPSFAAAPDRIVGAVDPSQMVRLPAGVNLKAQPKYDQGPVDPSYKLSYVTLLTSPSASQHSAMLRLLVQQQDPRSPLYHKWLTPQQYADRFGLSPNDINRITAWLKTEGFTVQNVARGRNWIVFSGTAAQIEKALHTEIHQYNVNGEMHVANSTSPSVPASLTGIVSGFRGLNDFHMKPMGAGNRAGAARMRPQYYDANFGQNFIAPGDVGTIYNVAPLYTGGTNGSGETLAVVGQTDIYLADLTDFRSGFSLPAISNCTVNGNGILTACSASSSYLQYVLLGTDPGAPSAGDLSESDLDLEWSGATAPNAQIIFVNAETSGGVGDAYYYAIDNDLAPVISMSYAICELGEADNGAFDADETELKKANSLGITFLNSSGDTGAAACDGFTNPDTNPPNLAVYGVQVNYPASSPEVTGVGGTALPYNDLAGAPYWTTTNAANGNSALEYIPEQSWDDPFEFAAYCAANPDNSFCTGEGITSAETAQEAIGIGGGGGGSSVCETINGDGVCTGGFPRPVWQPATFSGTTRLIPDVSLLATPNFPGYIFCTAQSELGEGGSTSTCVNGIPDAINTYESIIGGTSVSTPVFAGIVALMNQYLNGPSSPGLGNINSTLYALAATPGANAFHEVHTGTNQVYCQSGTPDVAGWPVALQCPGSGVGEIGFNSATFDAATGYNEVTGLGSINASNLAIAWAASQTGSATTTTVTSSLNPAKQGVTVTFTATVTTTGTNPPTGTVTFNDGSTDIGSGTLSTVGGNQVATFATSTLTVGTHSITAVYGGDANNAASTSAILTQTITAVSTTTTLTSSLNPAIQGQAVTFTATVATTGTHAPTGTVTFKNGSATLGMGTLSTVGGNQVATFATSTLPVGANSITAVYNGDVNNSGSTSAILTENITAPTFTLSTPTTPAAVLAGLTTTSTFTVTPTGAANFVDNVTFACSAGLPDATVTCAFSPAQINAGTSGATAVTLTFTTSGPNTAGGANKLRRTRADNRSDNHSPWLPLALPLAGIFMVGFAGRRISKRSAIAGLCVSLMLLGLLVACGGSNSTPPVAISVSPAGATVFASDTADNWPPQTAQFTATVTNTSNTAVTWAVTTTNGGTISSTGLYTAPTAAEGLPGSATITATSQADATKTASATVTITPTSVPGTYPITVTATEGTTVESKTVSLTID